jgi:predicted Zn-dependent peptidase
MTHFCEHLLFKGTRSMDWRELARRMNLLGGNFNASTSTDYVKVYAHVIKRDLGETLELISEMFLHSLFEESEVKREREVILEEIAQYEDIPEDLCYERFTQALFLPHPLGRPVIGTEELVASFTRDGLVDYWQRVLDPARMILSLAGDFEVEPTLEMLEKQYGFLPRRAANGALSGSEKVVGHGLREAISRDLEQINFCLGVTGPRRNHPDRFAWAVYDTILGGGMGSRLFDEIRERRGLAYSIGSNVGSFEDAGYLAVAGSTRPESAAMAIAICIEQLEDLAAKGATEEELVAAKRQMERSTVLANESMTFRATVNGEREIYGLGHEPIEATLEKLEAVNLDDVQKVAKDAVSFGQPALCVVGPMAEAHGLCEVVEARQSA